MKGLIIPKNPFEKSLLASLCPKGGIPLFEKRGQGRFVQF
jgi:hypothetical protein